MLDISKLNSDSCIPGIGETVYAIRKKMQRNASGQLILVDWIVPVIVNEVTIFCPDGSTELAWKGVGYMLPTSDEAVFGQVCICKDNIALTQTAAEAMLAKLKESGLSSNLNGMADASNPVEGVL